MFDFLQQRNQPLNSLLMGLLFSLLFSGVIGWPAALILGGTLGLGLAIFMGWIVYRSDFALRRFLAGAVFYMLCFTFFMLGASLSAAISLNQPQWLWFVGLVSVLTVVGPPLFTARLVRLELTAEGQSGAWLKSAVDFRHHHLNDFALKAPTKVPLLAKVWGTIVAFTNIPLLILLWQAVPTNMFIIPLPLLALGFVWLGTSYIGPTLGRTIFLLQLEHKTGQRLTHPEWAEIQGLRRQHWLARWFMKES
jgi:hypothetical protein